MKDRLRMQKASLSPGNTTHMSPGGESYLMAIHPPSRERSLPSCVLTLIQRCGLTQERNREHPGVPGLTPAPWEYSLRMYIQYLPELGTRKV